MRLRLPVVKPLLPAGGDWRFQLTGLALTGSMSSAVDLDACANVDVPFFDPFRFGCGAVSAYGTPDRSLDFVGALPNAAFRAYVPEPNSLALAAMALGCLAWARRRTTPPRSAG